MGKFNLKPSYRRNLPHIQPPGATLFLTFRLAGSLPQAVIDCWNEERKWLKHLMETNPVHYEKVKMDFERGWFRKFETILDRAESGPTWLLNNAVAAQVAESLHHRDGKVYSLDAYSIMPNHVHSVFKPLRKKLIADQGNLEDPSDEYHSLASIMQSLKGYTASELTGFFIEKENSGLMKASTIM